MESNSIQSTYRLGPSVSLDRGAPLFAIGECILIRIPENIQVEGYDFDEQHGATPTTGTDLPPVSTGGSGPQHLYLAFIREVHLQPHRSLGLEVYPVLSFTTTNTGGALLNATYHNMSDATAKAALLPLPPLSSRHPTPGAFGKPLDIGNWSTYKDSFLHVIPRRLTFPTKTLFKRMDPPLVIPVSELFRIDNYREYLLSTTNGGSEKAAGAGLEPVSVESIYGVGLLALEDVDEDAKDADATTRDELIMLAHDSPIWMKELTRYLQEEEAERERMQNERAMRLARWREDVALQPT